MIDKNQLNQSIKLIKKTIKNSGKIYIVGNGGSASIASHVSVDFAKVARVPSATFNNANLITCPLILFLKSFIFRMFPWDLAIFSLDIVIKDNKHFN